MDFFLLKWWELGAEEVVEHAEKVSPRYCCDIIIWFPGIKPLSFIIEMCNFQDYLLL